MEQPPVAPRRCLLPKRIVSGWPSANGKRGKKPVQGINGYPLDILVQLDLVEQGVDFVVDFADILHLRGDDPEAALLFIKDEPAGSLPYPFCNPSGGDGDSSRDGLGYHVSGHAGSCLSEIGLSRVINPLEDRCWFVRRFHDVAPS